MGVSADDGRRYQNVAVHELALRHAKGLGYGVDNPVDVAPPANRHKCEQ